MNRKQENVRELFSQALLIPTTFLLLRVYKLNILNQITADDSNASGGMMKIMKTAVKKLRTDCGLDWEGNELGESQRAVAKTSSVRKIRRTHLERVMLNSTIFPVGFPQYYKYNAALMKRPRALKQPILADNRVLPLGSLQMHHVDNSRHVEFIEQGLCVPSQASGTTCTEIILWNQNTRSHNIIFEIHPSVLRYILSMTMSHRNQQLPLTLDMPGEQRSICTMLSKIWRMIHNQQVTVLRQHQNAVVDIEYFSTSEPHAMISVTNENSSINTICEKRMREAMLNSTIFPVGFPQYYKYNAAAMKRPRALKQPILADNRIVPAKPFMICDADNSSQVELNEEEHSVLPQASEDACTEITTDAVIERPIFPAMFLCYSSFPEISPVYPPNRTLVLESQASENFTEVGGLGDIPVDRDAQTQLQRKVPNQLFPERVKEQPKLSPNPIVLVAPAKKAMETPATKGAAVQTDDYEAAYQADYLKNNSRSTKYFFPFSLEDIRIFVRDTIIQIMMCMLFTSLLSRWLRTEI